MPRRIDEIGFGGWKLVQDTDSFCYGVDAVLLADICRAQSSDRVLDLCCGNGAVSMMICAKYAPAFVAGIDIQADAIELAKESARLNGSENCSFVCGDAKDIAMYFQAQSFCVAVCNPPYFESGRGVPSTADAKLLARHESSSGLAEFFKAAAFALVQGGKLFMVHRPERLADIMQLSRQAGLEPKLLRPVVPEAGASPRQLLFEFVKGGGKGLSYLPELAVRNHDGSFTEEIEKIYCRK